jgi:pyruvate formate lyase activating enzyme
MHMSTGIIFDIKRFSIHDGPGIRTTVFLKGCPLNCLWCHNPEGLHGYIRLWYFENKCIHCGRCMSVCPRRALQYDSKRSVSIDHDKCDQCGICAKQCPGDALALDGRAVTDREVFDEIVKDITFYSVSGGGMTLSGGEALQQVDFCAALLKRCKNASIDTAMETSLYAKREDIKQIVPLIDHFIVDIKIFDEVRHKAYTGVSNRLIHENFELLAKSAGDILVRIPLIPGYTDDEKNLTAIARYIRKVRSGLHIELINYNPLAPSKYQIMKKEYKPGDIKPFTDDQLTALYRLIDMKM